MGLVAAIREAECIHDCDREGWSEPAAPVPPGTPGDHRRQVTYVRCRRCDLLLYETVVYLDNTVRTINHDDVFEALYTRSGRMALLAELMRDAGLDVPGIWER